MLDVIILAAGKGTRMCSNKPKVLHTLAGKPFLHHVVERAEALAAQRIHVVIGHQGQQVRDAMGARTLHYVEQGQQLGTGHAVQQVLPHLSAQGICLILYGDVPLITETTLRALCAQVNDEALGLLTVHLEQPFGYGRILRNTAGKVEGVVEQKDANAQQQTIHEVNTGVMAVRNVDLQRWLPQLRDDNAQGEYLLPDIIALAHGEGKTINTAQPQRPSEVFGINNRQQQAELERLYQQQQADNLMAQGLTLLDPARFDCRGQLTVGKDCVIDVNCVFEGKVMLGDGVVIGSQCCIKDSIIDDQVEIKPHSVLDGAEVGARSVVGPFARLRPQTKLAAEVKVGNFVEIKKSTVATNSKVNHLSYIGDAHLGSGVNVGAGTITCNYDGVNKSTTTIDDGVFVGSNSALVAPVHIGERTTIAAGSVITDDVDADALAIARALQQVIKPWKKRQKSD